METNIDNIVKNAKEICFFPAEDINKEPSVVLLVFESPQECEILYDALIVNKKEELFLKITKEYNHLNIKVEFKNQKELIHKNSLVYTEEELIQFSKIQRKDGKFVFGPAFYDGGQLIIVAEQTENPFLLLNGYDIL